MKRYNENNTSYTKSSPYSNDDVIYRLSLVEKNSIRQFWDGVTYSSIMWLCLIVLVLAVNVAYIKDVIIYAGQVSALQGDVNELPMMGVRK